MYKLSTTGLLRKEMFFATKTFSLAFCFWALFSHLFQHFRWLSAMDLRKQLCDDPENYINDPSVELQWAMMAAQKAQVHTNLILTSDTRVMKLCREQDLISQRFREAFPELSVKEVICFRTWCILEYNFRSRLKT